MKDAEIKDIEVWKIDHDSLQWGRVVKDAEISKEMAAARKQAKLQWGRVVKDAEIPCFGAGIQ